MIANAAKARSQGLEIEANYRVADGFTVRAGLSLLDAKFVKFPNAAVNLPRPGLDGNIDTAIDASGNRMYRAPKLTLSFAPRYTFTTNAGEFDLQATAYHSSRVNYDVAERISQKPYTTLDARASWTPSAFDWVTISVYGNNLTDVTRIGGAIINTNADSVMFAPPRTYGVEVKLKF